MIDNNRTVIAWNKAVEEMTGVPKTEMIGKGDYSYSIPFYGERRPILIDIVQEPDETIISDNYSIIKREGGILIAETKLPRLLGGNRYLHGTATALYNEKGAVVGAIESIRDITELKKTEQELRVSNEEMAATVEKLRSMEESLKENINDLQRTESALRESETKYRTIFENMQDLFYRTDDAGTITMISPSGVKIVSYNSKDEIIGKKNVRDSNPE